MGAHIIGANAGELRETAAAMRRMLKENGPPPTGRFADLAILEPVRHYKARHGSVMLVFDAVERAIDEIEGKRAGPARRRQRLRGTWRSSAIRQSAGGASIRRSSPRIRRRIKRPGGCRRDHRRARAGVSLAWHATRRVVYCWRRAALITDAARAARRGWRRRSRPARRTPSLVNRARWPPISRSARSRMRVVYPDVDMRAKARRARRSCASGEPYE